MKRSLVFLAALLAVLSTGCNTTRLASGNYELRWKVPGEAGTRLVPAALAVVDNDVLLVTRNWQGKGVELRGTMGFRGIRMEAFGSAGGYTARITMKGEILSERTAQGTFDYELQDQHALEGEWRLDFAGAGDRRANVVPMVQ